MSLDNEKKVIRFIEKSSRPLIVISKDPDGDTIGSALALFLALKKTGKTPRIVCSNKPSRKFSFLTGYDLIEREAIDEFTYEISFDAGEKGIENSYFVPSENNLKFYFKSKNCGLNKDSLRFKPRSFEYDSIFVIGSANLKSLGAIYFNNSSIFSNLPVVNIDYRSSNENFGSVNLIDSTRISISEIVAKVIEMSSFLKIDNEVASLLLVGIVEKTNNLQSSRVGSEIFYLTGHLFSLGARRNEIVKYLYYKNDKLELKRNLILILLLMVTGVLLFQITKIEPIENINNLELSQVLEENDQILFVDSEETESAKSSENIFENSGNDGDNNDIETNIADNNTNTSSTTVTIAKNAVIKEENNSQEKELPKKLEIPKIGVNAGIQHVGLDSNGKMGVPSNDWDVAWYNLGTKPGKIGSAVIAGHLDSKTGQPAVFWNLDKLGIGDYVYITDGNKNKKSFQVISVVKYETGTAPMEKIFGSSDGAYLNLITCGGVWDKAKNNYTERFVVFTEYVS